MSEKKYKTFADLKLVPQKESVSVNQTTDLPAPPVTVATTVTSVTPVTPVSPVKNFQKIPNSIVKDAIPAGLFKSGKTKELYDVLYSLTRGAIKPTRIVQIGKSKLQELSNINSPKTLTNNLLNLQLAGLVRVIVDESGRHGGNIYEVATPDETTGVTGVTPVTSVTAGTSLQKVAPVPPVESSPRNTGLNQAKTTSSSDSKTLIKTDDKRNDDERFAPVDGFLKKMDQVFIELTGKGIQQNDDEALTEIGELLAEELRAARLNTKSISKPAAFLAQHLKNRLSAPTRAPKPQKTKPDLVGKPTIEQNSENVQQMDLSTYTSEELDKFEKTFCLRCGKLHEECNCARAKAHSENKES